MAECILSKYYGMAPSEIEGMTVRSFNEYLKQIPAVERVFKGGSAAPEDCHSRESGNPAPQSLKELFKTYGIEVPDDG